MRVETRWKKRKRGKKARVYSYEGYIGGSYRECNIKPRKCTRGERSLSRSKQKEQRRQIFSALQCLTAESYFIEQLAGTQLWRAWWKSSWVSQLWLSPSWQTKFVAFRCHLIDPPGITVIYANASKDMNRSTRGDEKGSLLPDALAHTFSPPSCFSHLLARQNSARTHTHTPTCASQQAAVVFSKRKLDYFLADTRRYLWLFQIIFLKNIHH